MARQTHYDPRMPDPADCVLRPLLERWTADKPDAVFVLDRDGTEWTYSALRERVVRAANALRTLGLNQGGSIVSWLPNGIDAIIVWFAANYLGAVYVPINIAYKGALLEHVIANSDARIIVAHAGLVSRLGDIGTTQLEVVIAIGDGAPALPGLRQLSAEGLTSGNTALPVLEAPIEPWHTQSILYTSGTTGPSKGVLSSYLHLATTAGRETFVFLGEHDRCLITLPLFHVGGTAYVYAMLMLGGSIAILENFKTDRFWDDVRKTQSTACQILGAMAPFLLKAPPSPGDTDHPMRNAMIVPSDDAAAFHERFGIDMYTVFNMTETSTPIVSEGNPAVRGTCGKVRAGVEVRIVDENDCEVPPGVAGELLVRSDTPWSMNHGYHKNPEATAEAWRNGWFHTGDALRCDAEGNYFFVDRIKDSIRRRGENISSFEVEVEAAAFPAVREAAAVAVRSEFAEDEILIAVSPVEGESIDPAALIAFMQKRMAHFMVPRYVRIVPELPKTPTQKIRKVELRQEGLTADTWDREKDGGIVIKRETLR